MSPKSERCSEDYAVPASHSRRGWKKAEPSTWLLLAHGDQAQHAGNEGYDESPSKEYRYDAFVPNSELLDVGDFVLILDRSSVIGTAKIEKIERWEGTHTFRRCPKCRGTSLKKRASENPYYCDKCKDRVGFAEPINETVPCICYRALYPSTFSEASVTIASSVALGVTSGQHSIRKVDREMLAVVLLPYGIRLE